MKIGSIGYNHSHDKSFLMDRPEGTGCWLFLLIKTSALFTINGTEHTAKAGSAIIFSPKTPCSYRALESTYTDDWFYFSAGAADEKYFSEMGIPVDELMYLGSVDELSRIMFILTCEHYSADKFHDEIESRYFDILFMKISRILNMPTASQPGMLAERNASFTYIRSRIFTMPETVSGVDMLADEVGMSRSGFQHLYKKMFGVSIMQDIIRGRIERSKRLLVSTDLTVAEIAERCGYGSAFAFMRQFKEKCGVTPTEYRKSNGFA